MIDRTARRSLSPAPGSGFRDYSVADDAADQSKQETGRSPESDTHNCGRHGAARCLLQPCSQIGGSRHRGAGPAVASANAAARAGLLSPVAPDVGGIKIVEMVRPTSGHGDRVIDFPGSVPVSRAVVHPYDFLTAKVATPSRPLEDRRDRFLVESRHGRSSSSPCRSSWGSRRPCAGCSPTGGAASCSGRRFRLSRQA